MEPRTTGQPTFTLDQAWRFFESVREQEKRKASESPPGSPRAPARKTQRAQEWLEKANSPTAGTSRKAMREHLAQSSGGAHHEAVTRWQALVAKFAVAAGPEALDPEEVTEETAAEYAVEMLRAKLLFARRQISYLETVISVLADEGRFPESHAAVMLMLGPTMAAPALGGKPFDVTQLAEKVTTMCARCGRAGHSAKSCTASKHAVTNAPLDRQEPRVRGWSSSARGASQRGYGARGDRGDRGERDRRY